MNILALEQSSSLNSLALLDEGTQLARVSWQPGFRNNHALFEQVGHMLATSGVPLADIDAFAVGTGPGSFTALRCAVSAFRGLAVPDGKPVVGIPSGEAIASAAIERHGGERDIVVVGDARRHRAWVTRFRPVPPDQPLCILPPTLVPLARIAEVVTGPALVLGPDWDRIGQALCAEFTGPDIELSPTAVYPAAEAVGRIALRRLAIDREQPPALPIYLHPPVFVEPRYPVSTT